MSVSKEIRKKIGLRISIAREKTRMTQMQVAKHLNISRTNYTAMENGSESRHFKDYQIIELSKLFNVSTDYLLGLADEPSTDIEIQNICKKYGLLNKTFKKLEKCKEDKQLINKIESIIDILVS